jgi:hypothetical protein
MTKIIKLQVFLKGGGDDVTAIPEALLFRLARNIQENGCETLHLASGKSCVITGFMVTGSDFKKESRIIVVEGEPK